jgi:hypothetical protein
LKLPYLDLLT